MPINANKLIPTGFVFSLGSQTPVSGSAMQIDRLIENTPSGFTLQSEASIWPQTTYTYVGISREFTNSTVPGQGGSPLTTLFAFANNNGATGDIVALMGDAVARTSNGVVFGSNLIARSVSGVTSTKLVGLEIGIEPAGGTTMAAGSGGLFINTFNIAGSHPACLVGGLSSGTWQNGFLTSHITGSHYAVNSGDPTTAVSFIDTRSGTFSTTAFILGQGAGQGIAFGGITFGTNPFLYGDSGGDLILNMGTSGFLSVQRSSGVQGTTLLVDGTHALLNLINTTQAGIEVNGTQVISFQQTTAVASASFTANAGTAINTLSTFDGYTVPQVVKALRVHGLLQ